MIEVTLYSRADCHLCEQAKANLDALQAEYPHRLTIIDVDGDPKLRKEYGFNVPVVQIGPYKMKAPIEQQDLRITFKAVIHRENQIATIDAAIKNNELQIPVVWKQSDGFMLWFSRHYLAVFNLFVLIYVGLPFLAPVLMKVGAEAPAGWIYKAYSYVCHGFAYRSWYLFGEQMAYPRAAAGVEGLIPYEQATGLSSDDLWAAREEIGNEVLGYKVALCQRDVAIYLGILAFGLLFAVFRRHLKSLHWIIWLCIGIAPVGLDGVSQLLSQPPFNFLPYRESTPLIRTITGGLFGFVTAWFGYPITEETMVDNVKYLGAKFRRMQTQQKAVPADPGAKE